MSSPESFHTPEYLTLTIRFLRHGQSIFYNASHDLLLQAGQNVLEIYVKSYLH